MQPPPCGASDAHPQPHPSWQHALYHCLSVYTRPGVPVNGSLRIWRLLDGFMGQKAVFRAPKARLAVRPRPGHTHFRHGQKERDPGTSAPGSRLICWIEPGPCRDTGLRSYLIPELRCDFAEEFHFGDLHAVGAAGVTNGREEHLVMRVRHVVVECDRASWSWCSVPTPSHRRSRRCRHWRSAYTAHRYCRWSPYSLEARTRVPLGRVVGRRERQTWTIVAPHQRGHLQARGLDLTF